MEQRIGFWDGLEKFRKEKEKGETGKTLSLYGEEDEYHSERHNRILKKYNKHYYDSWGFNDIYDKTSDKEVVVPSLEYSTSREINSIVRDYLIQEYIPSGSMTNELKEKDALNNKLLDKYSPNFVKMIYHLKITNPEKMNEIMKGTPRILSFYNFYKGVSQTIQSAIMQEEYRIRDILKLYFNKDVVFDDKNPNKVAWLNMLLSMDTYYMKVSTNGSILYSSVITKNIVRNIAYELTLELFKKFEDESKDESENDEDDQKNEVISANNAGANINILDVKKLMDNLMGKSDNKDSITINTNKEIQDRSMIEKISDVVSLAIENANQQYSKMNSALSAFGLNESEMNIEKIEAITQLLDNGDRVDISKNMLSKFIKSRIAGVNKGMSSADHFRKVIPIEFIEADDLSQFDYYEALIEHCLLPEAESKEFIKTMKYDIYIDTSGSMQDGFQFGGSHIQRMLYAQMLSIRMIKFGFIDKIFGFEDDVYETNCSTDGQRIKSVFAMSPGGGTSFRNVVKSIQNRKRASLIITDGHSNYGDIITDLVYVMQLGGNNPEQIAASAKRSTCGKEIIKKKRYCIITDDGKAVYPS